MPDGYADCVDDNRLIYPGAVEVCDGVFNDCSDSTYSASGTPTRESDVDADGYVECADIYYADDNGCVCEGEIDSAGTITYSMSLSTGGMYSGYKFDGKTDLAQ